MTEWDFECGSKVADELDALEQAYDPMLLQNLPRKNTIPVFGLNKMFLIPAQLLARLEGPCPAMIRVLQKNDLSTLPFRPEWR